MYAIHSKCAESATTWADLRTTPFTVIWCLDVKLPIGSLKPRCLSKLPISDSDDDDFYDDIPSFKLQIKLLFENKGVKKFPMIHPQRIFESG